MPCLVPLDSGDTAVMMAATTFVMLQTPAAGFAQAGIIRRKNALSMIVQTVLGMAIGSITWFAFGYSLTFGKSIGGWLGGFSNAFFHDVPIDCGLPSAPTIPGIVFASFQMMFALMVPVLVTGAWAERMQFGAFLVFVTMWPILVYYPLAHWVWNHEGWMAKLGVKDFAGGVTIHTAAGVAAAAVSFVLSGRLKNRGQNGHHNLPLSVLGGILIWAGWYFFNGGSAFAANGQAARALINTHMSACVGAVTWSVLAHRESGYWRVSELINGAYTGLAGITAGSGFVDPKLSLVIGFICTVASYAWVSKVKPRLGLDDALDVTALQGVPGIIGSLLLGVFDAEDAGARLLGLQAMAVLISVVWTGVWTLVLMQIMKRTVGIDVSATCEQVGLDLVQIGEQAYDDKLDDVLDLGAEALTADLMNAVTAGDLPRVKQLIKRGADPEAADYDQRTPLHLAASEGRLNVIKYLVLQHGVDVNHVDRFGRTPLTDAITIDDKAAIEFLLAHGGSAKSHGATNDLELLQACASGDVASVKQRLKLGASVFAKDYDSRTALHIAAAEGNLAIVQVLLEAGADAQALDRWKNTPLNDAIYGRHAKCVKLLQSYVHGDSGSVPSSSSAEDDSGAGTQPLLATSTKFSSRRAIDPLAEGGRPAHTAAVQSLFDAAVSGDLQELKKIMKRGVDLAQEDYNGRSVLHIAAAGGFVEMVQYILRQKVIDVNAFDRYRKTPLQDALLHRHYDVCKILRDQGATVMDAVVSRDLCQAAASGDLPILQQMDAIGTDLNTGDYDGRTALHLAASEGQLQAVKYLVTAGVRVNPRDRWGNTPLDDAIRGHYHEIAGYLREHGGVSNSAGAS